MGPSPTSIRASRHGFSTIHRIDFMASDPSTPPYLMEGTTTMITPSRSGTLATLVLFLVSGGLRADEAEDKAVKAIEKLGGTVKRDEKADGKPVVAVDWHYTRVTDAGLKELAAFKHLRELGL